MDEDMKQDFSRGGPEQPTVKANPKTIKAIIADAIKNGNRLQANPTSPSPVKRRALIIAPQYFAHLRDYPFEPLTEGTLRDVTLVHEMLLDNDYNEADIRVLVEDSGDFHVQPNRENIIKSLEWLVSNIRQGDYRYLHFSGHGMWLESSKGKGKQAVEIPDGTKPEDGDTELDPSSKNPRKYQRVYPNDILVPEGKMKYYNEAIVTTYSHVPVDGGNNLEFNIIRDNELNGYLSKLPEGCRLTCTFDCCHSGRMLLCGVKIAGHGRRGKVSTNAMTIPMLDIGSDYDVDTPQNSRPENPTVLKISVPAQNDSRLSFVCDSSSPLQICLTGSRLTDNTSTVSRPSDTLPQDELNLDGIKADVLAWSACHQRQEAKDYGAGLFTDMFTSAIKKAKEAKKRNGAPITVRSIHEELETAIKKFAEAEKVDPYLQYPQVWTSKGTGSEDQAFEKLDQIFII